MIPKPIAQITKADIDALITDKRAEIKTLEYKMKLPERTDEPKKEFLADISSFANASGGDVIYGVEPAKDENGKANGEPKAIAPLVGQNPDETKLWFENSIRDGIAPKLPVQVKVIDGWDTDGKGFVVLIRIPKSFAAPHMVTCKGTSRFFSRHSAGKYQLDVGEIRNAFLATDSQAERIKRFREDRLAKILADETPVLLSSPHRVVLHLIPIGSFLNREQIDLKAAAECSGKFQPLYSGGSGQRFNMDGILTFSNAERNGLNAGYCQLFRDGCIETINAGVLVAGKDCTVHELQYRIPISFEKEVIVSVGHYLNGLGKLAVAPPFAVALTLLGVKDFRMPTVSPYYANFAAIDRDNLLLPEIIVDATNVDRAAALRPLFDTLWQACGWPSSPHYDTEGKLIVMQ